MIIITYVTDVIMMAGWVHSSRKGYATNGEWVSIPMEDGSKINGFCPMVYKQSDATYAYSYSSVRGAADGKHIYLKPNVEK